MCGLPHQGSTEKTLLLWKSLVGVYTRGTLLQLYRYTTFWERQTEIMLKKRNKVYTCRNTSTA